ncbi:hypothetical protein E1200_00075 [Actinomadura sp. GC306]|uniref:hypothetical protein n=1 Tax=Actinomadura sp. GC306 TaxID=2530367 RepID=UPI00104A55A5|nr:hypothetical protein [Actinomadura sp. GC306]TDC72002.1 hypothetical protein E1200_00075 [Actinomadura sp. GC306]
MTAGPAGDPAGGRPESERSDWTDQDLLTRGEAGDRIRAEIAETLARLDRTDPARAQERAALERRLAALRSHAAASPGPPGG